MAFADIIQDIKSISSCIFKIGISGWSGDSNQVKFGTVGSIDDSEGIV